MRISDWSSDVCSSDLVEFAGDGVAVAAAELGRVGSVVGEDAQAAHGGGSGGEIQPTKAWRRRHGRDGNAVVRNARKTSGRGYASDRSEEHTSELQSLMRISYAVFCLKKQTTNTKRKHYKKKHHK